MPRPSFEDVNEQVGRKAVVIQDGMRTTRAALAAEGIKTGLYARFKAALAGQLEDAKKVRQTRIRDTVFNSRYSRLIIQITAPNDIIDPRTGRKITAKPLKAKFQDSTFKVDKRTSDEDAKLIVEALRAHPSYGLGRDFWEAADAIDEGKLRKMASVAQTIESDPDIKNGILDWITATEFEAAASDGKTEKDSGEIDVDDDDDGDLVPVVRPSAAKKTSSTKGKPGRKPGRPRSATV